VLWSTQRASREAVNNEAGEKHGLQAVWLIPPGEQAVWFTDFSSEFA
jgi:hypothetical protein